MIFEIQNLKKNTKKLTKGAFPTAYLEKYLGILK